MNWCNNCRFAKHYEGIESIECRRFPPVMSERGLPGPVWPQPRITDWCGEYQSAEPIEEPPRG